jgi:antitoxin MazE
MRMTAASDPEQPRRSIRRRRLALGGALNVHSTLSASERLAIRGLATRGRGFDSRRLHHVPFHNPILEPTRCGPSDSGVRRPAFVRTNGCYRTDMPKRLTRSGNSLALVIDRPLLEALEIDADTELELSTDGDVLVVTPVRNRKRKKRTAELVAEAHEHYGGVFRRLAE